MHGVTSAEPPGGSEAGGSAQTGGPCYHLEGSEACLKQAPCSVMGSWVGQRQSSGWDAVLPPQSRAHRLHHASSSHTLGTCPGGQARPGACSLCSQCHLFLCPFNPLTFTLLLVCAKTTPALPFETNLRLVLCLEKELEPLSPRLGLGQRVLRP